jgi:hypothetical protein
MYVCTHIQSCTAHNSYSDSGDGDIGSDGQGNGDQSTGQWWEYLGKQISYVKTSATRLSHQPTAFETITGGLKLPSPVAESFLQKKASHPEAFSRACFQQ